MSVAVTMEGGRRLPMSSLCSESSRREGGRRSELPVSSGSAESALDSY